MGLHGHGQLPIQVIVSALVPLVMMVMMKMHVQLPERLVQAHFQHV
jgi:hypothetical protein